jgi:hypothetical protein
VIGCEADVFGHWYGNTQAELAHAYGSYREQTAFLAVHAGDGEVVGVCRLIRPGRLGLKTVADMSAAPWRVDAARSVAAAGIDLTHTWDVATIAVRRELGSSGRVIASALFHGLIQVSAVNRVDWMIAVLDRRARALMAAQGLEVSCPARYRPGPYLGSPSSTPVFARMAALLARQRQVDPQAHRMLAFGRGLDDVALPAPDRFRVHSVPASLPESASTQASASPPPGAVIDLRPRERAHEA